MNKDDPDLTLTPQQRATKKILDKRLAEAMRWLVEESRFKDCFRKDDDNERQKPI